MKLLFDHGTLVLAEAPDLSRSEIPGLLWDPRVALYRAPAFRHAEVVEALQPLRLPFVDNVRPTRGALTGAFRLPELRAYQQAAVLAWQMNGDRGVISLTSDPMRGR